MERLQPGTRLEGNRIRVPGEGHGPVVLSDPAGEAPHGLLYRASQGQASLLVTILDPRFVSPCAQQLYADVAQAGTIEHKNLLPSHGIDEAGGLHYLVHSWPSGGTVRTFIQKRIEQQKPIDHKTAFTLVGHVCAAVSALNRVAIHGYITVDTVYVTNRGRILVSSAGIGGCLRHAPGFARFRALGRLPNMTPEQLQPVPNMVRGTDVFGIAALLIELLTGRPLPAAGYDLVSLGLTDLPDLVECLQRATAPDPNARPPDASTFKAELAEALGLRPVAGRQATLPPTSRPPPPVPSQFRSPQPATPPPPPQPAHGPGMTMPPPMQDTRLPSFQEPSSRLDSKTTIPPVSGSQTESGLLDLGLDLEHLELASHRLSTLDGQSTPEPAASGLENDLLQAFGITPDPRYVVEDGSGEQSVPTMPPVELTPAQAPAQTPAQAPAQTPAQAPPTTPFTAPPRPTIPPDQRRYMLSRNGVDHGPYDATQLEEMLRNGTLRSVDTLYPTDAAEEVLVVDVPGLRQVCEQVVAEEERKRKQAAAPPPDRGRIDPPARSPWATLAIVLAVLAVFAVAWVLWERAGGAA